MPDEKITVTLILEISVTSPEEKAYYIDDQGAAAPSFIADTLDSWLDIENSTLLAINGCDAAKIKQALQAASGL